MRKLHVYSVGRLLIAALLAVNAFTFGLGGIREASADSNISEAKSQPSALKNKIFDDGDAAWVYNGNWSVSTIRRVYGGGLHISNVVGNQAAISITGSQFTLIFAKGVDYGKLNVYVDDIKITTINQKRSKTAYQIAWTSPGLGSGTHLVRFVHVSGKAVNIDAIKIRMPNTNLDPAQSPTPSAIPSLTPTAEPTSTPDPTATNTQIPTPTLTASPAVTASSTPMAGSKVYYVSVNGSDSNPGSQAQPWRSIQKAARTLIAGDTVYIRAGVYMENVYLSNSGTSTKPIRFLAYPGETPVIDGNNYQSPTTYWGVLLEISGNYVQVSGMEVRYSNWMGVVLSGQHDLASNMNVHHNRETGMLVSGDYGIVENSRVWQNANRNETNSPYKQGGWATGLSAARHPNYAILRGNSIYNNWGEGLSTFEANGTIMEDNVVYDNWSANVYISDATNVTLQRNLIYKSDNSIITSGSRVGIMMGDELYNPPSSNIAVINNLVYGAHRNFYWWQGVKGGGMANVLIASNTFVNSRSVAGVQIDNAPHQQVRFYNNIIQQDGALPVAAIDPVTGITFSHNLWSKKPPSIATGAGDILGDPKLAKIGNIASPGWYQLQASSPARNNAIPISEVIEDFFRTPRGGYCDMGALEYIE